MAQNPWAPWLRGRGGATQEQPLSGDVGQWLRIFSPTATVNGRGDPRAGGRDRSGHATYGAQLGPLSTLVLLAEFGRKGGD